MFCEDSPKTIEPSIPPEPRTLHTKHCWQACLALRISALAMQVRCSGGLDQQGYLCSRLDYRKDLRYCAET